MRSIPLVIISLLILSGLNSSYAAPRELSYEERNAERKKGVDSKVWHYRFEAILNEISQNPTSAVEKYYKILLTDSYLKKYEENKEKYGDEYGYMYSWSHWSNQAAIHATKIDSIEMTDLLAEYYGVSLSEDLESFDELEVREVLIKHRPRCENSNTEKSVQQSCEFIFNDISDKIADVDISVFNYGRTKFILEKRKGALRSYWIPISDNITAIY